MPVKLIMPYKSFELENKWCIYCQIWNTSGIISGGKDMFSNEELTL